MGWFYGFKLHVIINQRGELLKVKLTPGNCDYISVVPEMTQNLLGLLMADKGYINQSLSQILYERGLKLVTGVTQGFCMRTGMVVMIDKISRIGS